MVFRHFRIRDDQDASLRKLPGNDTEHVRRAIDDYLEKLQTSKVNASASKKGGENNG